MSVSFPAAVWFFIRHNKFYLKMISHDMLTEVKKLEYFFNIKDQTKLEHNNDLIFLVKCTENTCSENYLGETAGRINKRVLEHAG